MVQDFLIRFGIFCSIHILIYSFLRVLISFFWCQRTYYFAHIQKPKIKKPEGIHFLKSLPGASLVVQWLRFWASNAAGMGSIPDWETKIQHVKQRSQKIKIKTICFLFTAGQYLWVFSSWKWERALVVLMDLISSVSTGRPFLHGDLQASQLLHFNFYPDWKNMWAECTLGEPATLISKGTGNLMTPPPPLSKHIHSRPGRDQGQTSWAHSLVP